MTALVGGIGAVFALRLLLRPGAEEPRSAKVVPGIFWGTLTGTVAAIMLAIGDPRDPGQARAAVEQDARRQRHGLPGQAIEQVARGQAEFGVAREFEPALEEQRVGILEPAGEQEQVGGAAAHGRFRGGVRRAQAALVQFQHPG